MGTVGGSAKCTHILPPLLPFSLPLFHLYASRKVLSGIAMRRASTEAPNMTLQSSFECAEAKE